MNSSHHKASLTDISSLQNQWVTSSRALLHEPDSLLAHLHRGEMYRMARDGPAQQQQLRPPPRPLRDSASNALRSNSVSLQDLRDVIQQAAFIMDDGNDQDGATNASATDARSDSTHSSSSSHVHDLQRRHSYPPSQ